LRIKLRDSLVRARVGEGDKRCQSVILSLLPLQEPSGFEK